MVIRLIDVTYGRNNHWLHFVCTNGESDVNRRFYIDYSGTDLLHNMSLADETENSLKTKLNDDFGFVPFKIEAAKRVLKTHKGYIFR